MSLSRATALTRPVLRRWVTTTLVRKPPVSSSLKSRRRFLSTKAAEDDEGLAGKLQEVLCRIKGTINYFNVWTILRKVGVPYCMIIQFRRKMKKIYYVSGLSTIIRAAFPIIVGDLLAQTIYPVLFEKKPAKKKPKEKELSSKTKQLNDELKKNAKEINWCRTSHFAIIGGLFVGPLAKRWNLFWGRRIRRYPPGAYLSRVLILDALLLTPFIAASYMAGYDWKYLKDHFKENTKDSHKLQDKMRKRYETPFTDICLFYITTKPIVALTACFLLPCWMRNSTRKLYSFVFYCFVSHTITHFKLGEEITNRKKKHGKKGNHYDQSGGFLCMAFDKIHDLVKKDKK
ncbi:hypothetical protein GE061_019434 [Apolygus lucorum]|uniref:Uncharacterized protein n=1 Tax=Apolygus lucorum TaxID=248454 RepID=A0A6A4JW70_APOLU|nr:hypothetical protein GE061_019434 [Apolygus lucorum]